MELSIVELEFRNAMRRLWEDHVIWTRVYIVIFSEGLPDITLFLERLFKNQEDIGSVMKVFYGEGVENVFTELLKKHILIAGNVLQAVKCKNKSEDETAKWFLNADEIAAFLSRLNPCWNEQVLKAMLYEHLKLTTEEAVARLEKRYAADLVAYDKVHTQALQMADMLSEGIVKQFPSCFC